MGRGLLVLGVDTCGVSGTVALAGVSTDALKILGQTELAGRTYSATLVSAVEGLLRGEGIRLADVGAIVVVNGPGSFTGVRVGLSAVKGLAEPGRIPVVAVSRLEVLATKAGVEAAALDAHRHEVFLRVSGEGGTRELLAGMEELSHISKARCGAPDDMHLTYSPVPKSEGSPGAEELSHISSRCEAPGRVAVCDDAAAEMVGAAWGGVELVRVEAPTAADAIRLCVPAIMAGEFADLALLDGHYLRRSDAEIFGEAGNAGGDKAAQAVRVRRMEAGDIDRVMEIAGTTDHAPRWGREAYVAAVDPENRPRRVALVGEDGRGGPAGFVVAAILPGGEAELESIVTAAAHQRRGVARELFAALKPELRRQGVVEVILEVRDGNQGAREFYRYVGFREEGRRKGYYADPVEDAVLMRLGLG